MRNIKSLDKNTTTDGVSITKHTKVKDWILALLITEQLAVMINSTDAGDNLAEANKSVQPKKQHKRIQSVSTHRRLQRGRQLGS